MVEYVPQEEWAQIDAVQRHLAQKHEDLPQDRVAAVVQRACARFSQSPVRDFVPLVVERRAREELAQSTRGRAEVADARLAVEAASSSH
jgi:hypothetical protein